jgi:cysteinyl-tRNA synthetase
MFIFSSHYCSPIDIKDSAIAEAKANVEKLQDLITKIQGTECLEKKFKALSALKSLQEKFWQELEDDFNTPKAKAVLFEIVKSVEVGLQQNSLTKTEAKEILNFLKEINKIFLFLDFKKKKEVEIPEEIKKLAEQRETCRKSKNWQKADEIRKQIEGLGYSAEDTANGPFLRKT